MGNVKTPKYDNDLVNLGYLKEVLKTTEENIEIKNKNMYRKNYTSTPIPPYYVGDTYHSGNKIYRCVKDRLIGSFSLTDWVIIYDDKQNSIMAKNFLFLSEVDIKYQSDGKIETFYQDDDPSNEWDNSILKSEHEGDYWRTIKNGIYISYVYAKLATNPITYDWLEINVPITIFDTIREHKNIFTKIPNSYIENDFIKITSNEMINYFDMELEIGDYLYTTKTNSSFDASDWLKKEDDLSLKSLESFYYTTDQINKIVEVINSNVETDLKKTGDSIKAFVKQTYTEKTTTEELNRKINANGETIEEIKGINATEVPTMNLAELSILLDEISQTVSKKLTVTNTLSGTNIVEIPDAAEKNVAKFTVKGEISLAFPSENIFPSNNLLAKNSNLIIKYSDGTEEKIETPIKKMRKYGDALDEFIISSDETKLIKRVGVDENGQEYILEKEETIYYDNIKLPLEAGRNIIYFPCFRNDDLSFLITYVLKNELTDTFATRVEMASKILASANGILLETKKEIETATEINTLVSRINMSPENIRLLAKKIIFEGLVTANNNFKILEDGSIETRNGYFSGKIEVDDGYFKGNVYLNNNSKVIGGDGLLTTRMIEANIKSIQFVGGTSLLPMGFSMSADGGFTRDFLEFNFEVPSDFVITKAYIILDHTPISYSEYGIYKRTGFSRNLKLYKSTSKLSSSVTLDYGYYSINSSSQFQEINNAFGGNGFTGSTTGSSVTSIDVTSYIDKGFNFFKIQSDHSIPSSYEQAQEYTGACKATLYINGYTKFN